MGGHVVGIGAKRFLHRLLGDRRVFLQRRAREADAGRHVVRVNPERSLERLDRVSVLYFSRNNSPHAVLIAGSSGASALASRR
jgi:hypothetical protein